MWLDAFCYLHLGLFFPWCLWLSDLWPIVGSRSTSWGPLFWTCGEKVAIAAKPDLFSSWAGRCPHYTLHARDLLPGCSAAGIWGRKCEDNEGADIKTSNRETQGTSIYAAHRQSGKNRNTENGEEREGSRNGKNMGRKRGKRAEERQTRLTFRERRQRKCQNIVSAPSTGIVP